MGANGKGDHLFVGDVSNDNIGTATPCAIQTQLGSSSLLEEWSVTPIVFVVFFVLSATPQTGGNGQGI